MATLHRLFNFHNSFTGCSRINLENFLSRELVAAVSITAYELVR